MPGKLITRTEGPVGWLVFSNPERHNAITYDMWRAMPEAMHKFDTDPNIRVIAVTGDGDKAFVSGADISEFERLRGSADASAEYNRASQAGQEALINTAAPTVAVIRGICFGGGVGLAISCDMRIAADNAKFCIPAARLGLGYYYSGIKRLVDIVGPAYAAEIFATARRYTAAQALQMGLANHVLPTAEFDAFVAEYLGQIGENAPLTIAAAMRAIDEALKPESDRELHAVEDMIKLCFASEDYKEGRTAFMEKRKPAFKGR
jgi:enoyl-CoA hydratase